MKEFLVTVGLVLACVFGIGALGTVAGFWNFAMFSYFAPKVVAVQNQVFHESQQYNDGMLANLSDLMLEYKRAKNQEERDALAAVIHQQYGRYPQDRMPPNLRDFYNSL